MIEEGELLAVPSAERIEKSQLTGFMRWLASEKGRDFADYRSLWCWSVEDPGAFWSELASWAEVPFRAPPSHVLEARARAGGGLDVEGARFFEGAELNYVDLVLGQDRAALAVVARDEAGNRSELTYGALTDLAGRIAAGLRRLGVRKGDRVAAVLPNGIGAVASFLAAASLGAIWSSCAPEFGASAMADRLAQIEPSVLITVQSYRYAGREISLAERLQVLTERLPAARVTSVDELASGPDAPLEPVAVPFSHPLWILYSSGTTGLPKAIVHAQGGIVLEHLKILRLHGDVGPGSRFFWFTTTGWMMWNYLAGGLLTGATIVLYDGSPVHPDELALWRMAAEERVCLFGTSAPFIDMCMRAGLRPRDAMDLSAVTAIGSTGAPLSPEGFAWASEAINDDLLVQSVSGGTDVCTAFLAGAPTLPVHAGELQCAALGARVEALGPDGTPVVGEVGELVISTPMPSMPIALWADADGSRLHESYFAEFPGLWRHGDWVKETERHTFVVYGRSDATLNRGGVRMGTSEFYRVVESVPGVADALVIDTSALGHNGELVLLVVPSPGTSDGGGDVGATGDLAARITAALRTEVSPRHVPDRIIMVDGLPRTLNGKKVEVPLRRILLGADPAQAVSRDALADPGALDAVIDALGGAGLL